MHPEQQSSSSVPWSDEEIQLFIKLREDMEVVFRLTNKTYIAGLWEELSRRFAALGHQRSPEELQAKFGQYKPRTQRKKSKQAPLASLQAQAEDSSALQLEQREQPQDQRARNQGVEAARKKLLEEIDLNAFFSEKTDWRAAIISLKQGRPETVFRE